MSTTAVSERRRPKHYRAKAPHSITHPPPPPHLLHSPPPPHHHRPPTSPHHLPPSPYQYYEFYYGIPREHAVDRRRLVIPCGDPIEAGAGTHRRNLCSLSCTEWVRFFRIFTVKLILEVFGASGAIWGFSEALTLRTNDTQEFWRKIAMIVGIIFLFRYVVHAREYLREISAATVIPDSLELDVEDTPTTTVHDTVGFVRSDSSEQLENRSLMTNDDQGLSEPIEKQNMSLV